MWTKPLPRDKVLHFMIGYLLTHVIMVLSQTLGLLSLDPPFSYMAMEKYLLSTITGLLLGFFVVLIASFIKEEYDRRRPDRHTKDSEDILAAVLGSTTFAVSTSVGLAISVLFYV